MPKTKEDKLNKKTAAKEAKKEKQLIKAHKKKAKEQGLTVDECDIQVLIQKFQQTKQKESNDSPLYGKLIPCEQPTPRASCSLTLLPSNDFFLFGGEFYEGSKAVVYNETYRWNIEKNEWRLVDCLQYPPPRCSHQAALFKEGVYIFGGEFATVEQFYHFRDLWKFDIKNNVWEEIKCTGVGPSARSGHRMTVYKNQLIVFGGFHDTLRETRYFNDLYILTFNNYRWHKITVPHYAQMPSPRSGVMMASYPLGDGILICGGYCKVKDTAAGAQGRCLEDSWWLNMKRVNENLSGSSTTTTLIWEKLGKKASVPAMRSGASMVTHKAMAIAFGGVCDEDQGGTSLRSVFYNDLHAFDLERKKWFPLKIRGITTKKAKKNKGIGSVNKTLEGQLECSSNNDQYDQLPSIENSELLHDNPDHVETFQYDSDDDDNTTFGYIDQNGKLVRIKIELNDDQEDTLQQLPAKHETTLVDALVAPKSLSMTAPSNQPTDNIVVINSNTNSTSVTQQEKVNQEEPVLLEPDSETPLPRLNAAIAMRGNELVIYGGLVELGSKELTLDDCWTLNINCRQKWNCILKGHLEDHPWNEEKESVDDSSSYEDDDDDDDELNSCDSDTLSSNGINSISDDSDLESDSIKVDTIQDKLKHRKKKSTTLREEMSRLQAQLNAFSIQSEELPQCKESLREFFERNREYWMNKYIHSLNDDLNESNITLRFNSKEARRGGFDLASSRYTEIKPLLEQVERLEELQRQAELDASSSSVKNNVSTCRKSKNGFPNTS